MRDERGGSEQGGWGLVSKSGQARYETFPEWRWSLIRLGRMRFRLLARLCFAGRNWSPAGFQ